ncbi:GNAT family N-acetyltransferase [Luteolibacter marinus]|uniref:GNAT family N-acetyltransferase n=1 Tax=Luteolibacter marinus TaxID=2776705 RepID=UPI001D00388B|nr:GNAT family N-acetyltransferase [Luteolibacter marinus]
MVFPQTYESLDPGCCLVAEIDGVLAGSCFYHPRETHVGLGIMNAAPEFAGRGVARALLAEIIRRAGDLPVRLVSSALNLDSYSLYTKAGFRPVALFQDMVLLPDDVLELADSAGSVRRAVDGDLPAMLALEEAIAGVRRAPDLRHFLANDDGHWTTFVHLDESGCLDGWLASVDHPGSRLIGPGVMREERITLALIRAQQAVARGGAPVILVPAAASALTGQLYRWGARNVELHVLQVHGSYKEPAGIVMPTFLPESG